MSVLAVLAMLATLIWQPAAAAECAPGTRVEQAFSNGARWSLCWRIREQDGLVIESAAWTPPGGTPVGVLASGSLAQLHVAYDDSDVTYSDVTQYGLGGGWLQTLTGTDCPGRLLAQDRRDVLCVMHEAPGQTDATLVLFSVSQVGAYVYIVTWRFGADGSLQPSIGASGALQRRGKDVGLPFGRVLAGDPDTLWLSHTHNYYWRLDVDLGEAADDDLVTRSDYATLDDGRRTRTTHILDREAGARLDRSGLQAWHLRARPPTAGEPLSRVPGYRLDTSNAGHAFVRVGVERWSGEDLFVTVQRDCERFASQNGRFEPGCGDDVAAYVDGEPLGGQDLVIWQRIAFHHVPRNEDRQYMHTHWDGFRLLPENLVATAPGPEAPRNDAPGSSAPARAGEASGGGPLGPLGSGTLLALLLLRASLNDRWTVPGSRCSADPTRAAGTSATPPSGTRVPRLDAAPRWRRRIPCADPRPPERRAGRPDNRPRAGSARRCPPARRRSRDH